MDYQEVRGEGFEHEKNDCSVRAMTVCSELPYATVHQAFKDLGRKDGRGTLGGHFLIPMVCEKLGLKATLLKETGGLLALKREFPTGRIFCTKRGHAFSVIDGVAHDVHCKRTVHIVGAWKIEKA